MRLLLLIAILAAGLAFPTENQVAEEEWGVPADSPLAELMQMETSNNWWQTKAATKFVANEMQTLTHMKKKKSRVGVPWFRSTFRKLEAKDKKLKSAILSPKGQKLIFALNRYIMKWGLKGRNYLIFKLRRLEAMKGNALLLKLSKKHGKKKKKTKGLTAQASEADLVQEGYFFIAILIKKVIVTVVKKVAVSKGKLGKVLKKGKQYAMKKVKECIKKCIRRVEIEEHLSVEEELLQSRADSMGRRRYHRRRYHRRRRGRRGRRGYRGRRYHRRRRARRSRRRARRARRAYRGRRRRSRRRARRSRRRARRGRRSLRRARRGRRSSRRRSKRGNKKWNKCASSCKRSFVPRPPRLVRKLIKANKKRRRHHYRRGRRARRGKRRYSRRRARRARRARRGKRRGRRSRSRRRARRGRRGRRYSRRHARRGRRGYRGYRGRRKGKRHGRRGYRGRRKGKRHGRWRRLPSYLSGLPTEHMELIQSQLMPSAPVVGSEPVGSTL